MAASPKRRSLEAYAAENTPLRGFACSICTLPDEIRLEIERSRATQSVVARWLQDELGLFAGAKSLTHTISRHRREHVAR